jgi:hypothetical protein
MTLNAQECRGMALHHNGWIVNGTSSRGKPETINRPLLAIYERARDEAAKKGDENDKNAIFRRRVRRAVERLDGQFFTEESWFLLVLIFYVNN